MSNKFCVLLTFADLTCFWTDLTILNYYLDILILLFFTDLTRFWTDLTILNYSLDILILLSFLLILSFFGTISVRSSLFQVPINSFQSKYPRDTMSMALKRGIKLSGKSLLLSSED